MAIYIGTDDQKILIDPSVALVSARYGLKPHPIELQRMNEVWNLIKNYAKSCPEIYERKRVFIKHPQKILT